MDVTYTIVKVYVPECNDVIKCHSNVITIWRMSAIEVTVLSKNVHSEMKGVQEKESIMSVRGRQINPCLTITIWHHWASRVMPDSDPRDGFFYLLLTPMIDPCI